MNFAVIEYHSKSGRVWRHTSEHPNYLADPIKEIDPTSFGCYVSALEGEHIPILSFITGELSKAGKLTILTRKVIKRLTSSWPQTYDLSYLATFDALLVVYQISDDHEIVAFLKRLRQQYPHLKIIGVPTQHYGALLDHWKQHPQAKNTFIEFMDSCHVFLTVVKRTTDYWQGLTSTPVVYLPQPYPVEHTLQAWQSHRHKKPIIFVAGDTARPNIIRGQKLAATLQQEFPQYAIHVTKIEGHDLDTSALSTSRFETLPFQHWQEHLTYLSKVFLTINTDYTQTRGRVQVDCAAAGTPSIGANSDGQDDLFPLLPAEEDMTDQQLLLQARRLLTEPDFYQKVANVAKNRLMKYNYEHSATRLLALINSIEIKK